MTLRLASRRLPRLSDDLASRGRPHFGDLPDGQAGRRVSQNAQPASTDGITYRRMWSFFVAGEVSRTTSQARLEDAPIAGVVRTLGR